MAPDQSKGKYSSSHAYQQQSLSNLGCSTVSDAGRGTQTLGVMHHASHASHPKHYLPANVYPQQPLQGTGQLQWLPEQLAQQHSQGNDIAQSAARVWDGHHQGGDFDISSSAGGSSTSSVAGVAPLPGYDKHGNVVGVHPLSWFAGDELRWSGLL